MEDGARARRDRFAHGLALVATLGLGCVGVAELESAWAGEAAPPSRGTEGGANPAFEPGTPLARRLTSAEYVVSLEDALGLSLQGCGTTLPGETRTHGFTNTAVGLVVTAEHVDSYLALAECVGEAMVTSPARLEETSSCQALEPACEEGFVRTVGRRLFRRPVTAEELSAFSPLFRVAEAEGLGFPQGAGLVLSAMVQSPQFLYRLEPERTGESSVREVDGFALATRLSYLAWGSGPDEALLKAAEEGALASTEGLAAQVDRLLADPKSSRSMEQLARDAWALDQLQTLTRADLSPALASAMGESAVRTYLEHSQGGLPLGALLSAGTAELTPELATFIGLEARGEGWRTYELPADQGRGGFLTHPGVLAVMADRDVGGIVSRGLYVLENVLCEHPLSPPPDLDLSMFRSHLGPGASERAYSEDRLATAACAGCHRQFDPLAYGFERFDGVGRHRTQDPHGNALRSDGTLVTAEGQRDYADAAALGTLLAGSGKAQRCFTQKHLQFALGRPLTPMDREVVEEVHERAREAGGTYLAVARAVALHPLFRLIRTE